MIVTPHKRNASDITSSPTPFPISTMSQPGPPFPQFHPQSQAQLSKPPQAMPLTATSNPFTPPMARTASPSDVFGGAEPILQEQEQESQDWVWRDQTSLADGFENWGLPAGSSEDGSPAMANIFPENGYMQPNGFGAGPGAPRPGLGAFGTMGADLQGMDAVAAAAAAAAAMTASGDAFANSAYGADPVPSNGMGVNAPFDGRNVFNGVAIGGGFDPNKGSFGDMAGFDEMGWY